jgi:CDP-diacylglycerol--glycerol-3-phosphate 3-phosphatidyltransferase
MERTIGVAAQNPRRPHIWNLPNLITLVRIAAIPFVVLFLFFPGAPESFLAALIFSAASLTDLLDGYIARQQNSETPVGKLLDPLADKLLINSALIMLIPLGRVPAWVVVLIVGREIAVTGLRGIASLEGLAIAASKWGKAKMIFQTIALIGLMLHYEYLGIDFHSLGMLILWIALAITIWSGVDYFIKFYRGHRKTAEEGKS